MNSDENDDGIGGEDFERYLELCVRIYERMERENSWPWELSKETNGKS